MSNTRNRFTLEVRARAVRMVLENESDYSPRWAAITSISAKIGCVPQTLSSWVKRKEVDSCQGRSKIRPCGGVKVCQYGYA